MLSNALKILRIFSEMSQTEMARRLGVTKSWVSEIENGHKDPTLSLLKSYSEVLDIPLSSILFFSENMENGDASERTRLFVSKKILAILNFIAARSGKDESEDEGKSEEVSAQPVAIVKAAQP